VLDLKQSTITNVVVIGGLHVAKKVKQANFSVALVKTSINIGNQGGVCEVEACVSQNISSLITSLGSASVELLPKPYITNMKARIPTF
jgi:hypothetical protein